MGRFKVGDNVYAWSNERYGKSYIVECAVEEVNGEDLYLYAYYDNRAFYRNENDVMSYEELMENIGVIKKDHDNKENC